MNKVQIQGVSSERHSGLIASVLDCRSSSPGSLHYVLGHDTLHVLAGSEINGRPVVRDDQN